MAVQTLALHSTSIDLAESTRQSMVELLNRQLAATSDLHSQTKQAHWNVKGLNFIALHELFDKLAQELAVFVDSIAERATALGGTAFGTVRMAAARSSLKEYPGDLTDGKDHVKALAERYAAYGAANRTAINKAEQSGDAGTEDLFIEISRAVDKSLWFLEAHMQR